MYGAILGDIIGSRFEFDRGPWKKEFELFTNSSHFTDDTVMTVAIAEGLLDAGKDADIESIKHACIKAMKRWGQKYPSAGYGNRFISWVLSDEPTPYGSWGNGSAMRVSPAGWLYDSLDRTREVARATAEVTHNHPEGIKGAECTAAVMFLAREGKSKEEIKEYVINEFGYDISESLEDMRKRHRHDESCMDSLPKALAAFVEGESFEDVIRNAVSLGGDTDTIAAIAGAMAEAFFKIPVMHKVECLSRVDEDILEVIKRFDMELGRTSEDDDNQYEANAPLNAAYCLFISETDEKQRVEGFYRLLDTLAGLMMNDAIVPMPFVDKNNVLFRSIEDKGVLIGDEFGIDEEIRLTMDTMRDGDGDEWLPLFIDDDEVRKGQTANIVMPVLIYDVLNIGLHSEDLKGVVINPFDKPFTLTKDILQMFLNDYEKLVERNKD